MTEHDDGQVSGRPLSGEAHTIAASGYVAHIASVGASLRALTFDGRDLVVPFEAEQMRPAYRGATLAPWPNRVTDGTYSFDGVDLELALTERERGHAMHGLVAWLDFTVVSADAASVTLTATIEAQSGYPFRVRVDVAFRVSERGLRTTVSTTNVGPSRAPVGVAAHPYLVAGDGVVDGWELEVPAERVLTVIGERMLPGPIEGVADVPDLDFRTPRTIGSTEIDHAFTRLVRGEDGVAVVRARSEDGSGVGMRWDEACGWVQVHTADRPGLPEHRIGLAVEPMTCPPDAFNSGTDLTVIDPGGSMAASWEIFAIHPRE